MSNKDEIMCSQEIKQKVFEYYRKKQSYLFSTENLWKYLPDCIIVHNDKMIEVEVKCSWNDFLADFKNKKEKHEKYANAIHDIVDYNKHHGFDFQVPNLFYFCSSDHELCVAMCKYLEQDWKTSKYGVLYARKINNCLVMRDPIELHERPIHRNILLNIQSRMSSDYVKKMFK